jgi:hypothetical protein
MTRLPGFVFKAFGVLMHLHGSEVHAKILGNDNVQREVDELFIVRETRPLPG